MINSRFDILMQNSDRLAECYTQLTESLRAQGVPEYIARDEARMMALEVTFLQEEQNLPDPDCPICGQR